MPDIGAVVHSFGDWETLAVDILKGAWRAFRRRSLEDELAEEAKDLLGLDRHPGIAYRHDSVHPDFLEGTLHPDNLDALQFAAGSYIARAEELNSLTVLDEVRGAIEHNQVLIGSPTAEGLSRVIFGYAEYGSADCLRLDSPTLDLPYRWQLDSLELGAHAQALRFVRGRGWVARPNWQIICDRPGRPDRYTPEVDDDGRLRDDYLLITRLRNFLSPSAIDMGRFIVSFGGTHGTGTRALELLLKDSSVLSRIAKGLAAKPTSYQILLQASRMKHDARIGTRATALSFVDAIELPDSHSSWLAAHARARAGLEAWLGRSPLEL